MQLVQTYRVVIYIAGDLAAIRQVVREYCYDVGACVTITPTTFVYTGGEEEGVAIGLVNYPRFPATVEELRTRAETLALVLLPRCNQRTALIVADDETRWLVIEPPGAR